LVVSWTHSAVSTGTVMALAMTRALSVAAPDIAWVNCLNIYFISGSLVTPFVVPPGRAAIPGGGPPCEPDPSLQVLARPEDGRRWRKSSGVKAKAPCLRFPSAADAALARGELGGLFRWCGRGPGRVRRHLGQLGMELRELLMVETTAFGAGVDPARITLAAGRRLPGASCDRDDHRKVVFAQLLARQLEHLLMVLTAESVKGRAVLPLLIQPSMLIASHLAALLQAGSGNLAGTATGYPERVRQAAEALKGPPRCSRRSLPGQPGPPPVTGVPQWRRAVS